jgi:hypothetical protein
LLSGVERNDFIGFSQSDAAQNDRMPLHESARSQVAATLRFRAHGI